MEGFKSAIASFWGISESAITEMWQILNPTSPQDWGDVAGELNEEVQDYFSVLSLGYLDSIDPPFLFLVGTWEAAKVDAESYAMDVQALGGDADVVTIEGAAHGDFTHPNDPSFPLICEAIETFLAEVFAD